MDTKALRQKILDLAIRGKLVPQDPNDEPASVLLERIRQQKQQMVKEGKLKPKDIKKDSVIFVGEDNLHYEKFADGSVKCIEDEIPLELPGGWAWSRLVSLSSVITDGEHKTPRRINEFQGYYLLSARNIQNGFLSLTDVDFVDKIEFENISKRCNPKDNDVLISCSGSIGRVTVVNDGNDYVMVRSAAMVRPIGIDPYYLMFALQSGQIQTQMQKASKQTAQANLFLGAIQSLLIPVPPLSEQIRIAKKLSNIWTHVQQIDVESETVSNIISKVKSKILDLAIRGQLVPQDPTDEPASVLLERIRAEKEELIKQGKIKRDKKESFIFRGEDNSYYEKIGGKVENISDEIPFELPDGWMWCRGRSCFAGMESTKPQGEFFDYIDIDAIDNRLHRIKTAKHIPVSEAPSRASRAVKTGSVLFSLVRPYLENIALVEETHSHCIASTGFYVCNSNGILLPQFMFFLMISSYVVSGLNQYMKGDNSPSISKDNIESWLYPIPPMAEQKAICAKLKKVFNLIEKVENSLS